MYWPGIFVFCSFVVCVQCPNGGPKSVESQALYEKFKENIGFSEKDGRKARLKESSDSGIQKNGTSQPQDQNSNDFSGSNSNSSFRIPDETERWEKLEILKALTSVLPNDESSLRDNESPSQVCYKALGCFSMQAPWVSILRPMGEPMDPEDIHTSAEFYSRENIKSPVSLSLYPDLDLNDILFDPQRTTVFIVHGFASTGRADWLRDLKDAYLKNCEANVFTVDWGGGAQLLNYLQVAANTRVVGKVLARLVEKLIKVFGVQAKDFHLIGHSLGSHICSYVAKDIPGIGRLTALDPAQPGFEGFDKAVRLDRSDAEFVEVLHTNSKPFIPTLGFGMIGTYGHVDFYFNGGATQPGCFLPLINFNISKLADLSRHSVETIASAVACPHSRAYKYFIEALSETKCTFWGQKISAMKVFEISMNTLTQGTLSSITTSLMQKRCSEENCIPLGIRAKKSTLRGSFMVLTGNKSPFCIY